MSVTLTNLQNAIRGCNRVLYKGGTLNIQNGQMLFVALDNTFVNGTIQRVVFPAMNIIVITTENNEFTFKLD